MESSEESKELIKTRLIGWYVSLSNRRPKSLILLLLLVTIAFALSIPRLDIDSRLEALLPPDTPIQKANAEARERFAAASPFYLVVQSSDPALNRRIARQARDEVQRWPETLVAINQRDASYFLDRRLLYVDAATLDSLADDVELYLDWHKCEKMPGCENLEDEPPEPDFEKLKTYYEDLPALQALVGLFGEENVPDPEAGLTKKREAPEASESSASADAMGELCGNDGKVCVVQVTLDGAPSDLDFATRLLVRGEALLEQLTPPDAPADLKTAVTGVYRNLPLTRDALMRDLLKTGLVTLLLVVGVLLLQFRRFRAVVLLLVPVVIGSVWALGLFGAVGVTFNVISAAVLIILAGLGIDFGLHVLTHYGAQRQHGLSPVRALVVTLDELLSSLWVAALTTACGFLALTAAKFRGFSQMGLLASIGILFTLLATLLAMPPLIVWIGKRFPIDDSLTRKWRMPRILSEPWGRRGAIVATVVGALALVLGAEGSTRLELLYDMNELLSQKASGHGTDYGKALHGTNRSLILLLADDPKSLEEAAEGVRQLYPDGISGREGASVVTPGTFIPPEQKKRLTSIARLRRLADDSKRYATGKTKDRLEAWQPLLAVDRPITQEQMPSWVLDSFAERDGTFGTVGVMYNGYSGSDARQMMQLTDKLEDLRLRYPKVRFASNSAVLGEVMPLLSKDGYLITALALGGLVLGTLLIGRSVRRMFFVVSSVVIAVSLSAAAMVFFGWKVNFYNMLVFPVAFGIGVDGAIYVVWTVYRRKGVFDWSHLPVSARAVLASTLTTLVAFGSLMVSDNGGLASLGRLAATALTITLLTNLLWLPAALSVARRWGHTRETIPPPATEDAS